MQLLLAVYQLYFVILFTSLGRRRRTKSTVRTKPCWSFGTPLTTNEQRYAEWVPQIRLCAEWVCVCVTSARRRSEAKWRHRGYGLKALYEPSRAGRSVRLWSQTTSSMLSEFLKLDCVCVCMSRPNVTLDCPQPSAAQLILWLDFSGMHLKCEVYLVLVRVYARFAAWHVQKHKRHQMHTMPAVNECIERSGCANHQNTFIFSPKYLQINISKRSWCRNSILR